MVNGILIKMVGVAVVWGMGFKVGRDGGGGEAVGCAGRRLMRTLDNGSLL